MTAAINSEPFPPGSAVVFYGRDSGGVKQDLSCDQQEQVVRDWCDARGYTLTHLFIDRARSGGSTIGRTEFDRLLKYFQSKPPEAGVVFWDLSRWARNIDDGQYYLAAIRRLGYAIHSLEQQIPPGSIGRVVESLHLWAADEYRANLTQNIKRGLYYMAATFHAYPRGNPPPGYRKVPLDLQPHRDGRPHVAHGLEPDPLKAPLVQQVFRMRAAGATINEIHAATGLFVNRVNYQYMLKNELYLGIFNLGDIRVVDFCEPLIDRGTWEVVQEINRRWAAWRHEKNLHPRRARSPFLLSGLAHCKACGRAMSGDCSKSASKGYRYYVCGSNRTAVLRVCPALNIRAERVDEKVLELTRQQLQDESWLDRLAEAVRAELASQTESPDVLVNELAKQLDGLNRSVRRNLEMAEMAGPSRALADRLVELEKEIDLTDKKLEAARQRAEASHGLDPLAAERAAAGALVLLTTGSQQMALRQVIERVDLLRTADGIEGVVHFNLPGLGSAVVEFRL